MVYGVKGAVGKSSRQFPWNLTGAFERNMVFAQLPWQVPCLVQGSMACNSFSLVADCFNLPHNLPVCMSGVTSYVFSCWTNDSLSASSPQVLEAEVQDPDSVFAGGPFLAAPTCSLPLYSQSAADFLPQV